MTHSIKSILRLSRSTSRLTAERDAAREAWAVRDAEATALQAKHNVALDRIARLERLLAVERGGGAVPSGWLGEHGAWWKNHDDREPTVILRNPKTETNPMTTWSNAPKNGPQGKPYDTALEAMEAMEAADAARRISS